MKASAGSGKTFRLVRFYMQLCFNHMEDSFYFSKILAITFTNKATEEMKERILKEFKVLADDPEESDHLDYIKEQCHLATIEIQQHSKRIYRNMVLNYEQIAVSTIDSFFQKVLRGFARDLNLDTSYQIQIDNTLIIDKAVNLLIADINPEHPLYDWLGMLLEDRISKGKHFDLKNTLNSIANEVYSEEIVIEDADKLDVELFADLYNHLNNRAIQIEKEFEELKNKLRILQSEHGLVTEELLYKKTNAIEIIVTKSIDELDKILTSSRIQNTIEDVGGICGKKDIKNETELYHKINRFYEDGACELVQRIYQFSFDSYSEWLTIKAIKENFIPLLTISYLIDYLKIIRRQENWIVLSETNAFLVQLMEKMHVPYLYERIASEYHHLLIDEFQDTSQFQWTNLQTLVDENISIGKQNLLVGDVKQAIYRFRNGKWSLLQSEIENNYTEDELIIENLDTNWRSDAQIINFNNNFFKSSAVPSLIAESIEQLIETRCSFDIFQYEGVQEIAKIYEHSYQNVPPTKTENKGYVEINFFDVKNAIEDYDGLDSDDYEFDLAYYNKFIEIIESAYHRGYQPKDIAILCNEKKLLTLVSKMIELLKDSDDDDFSDFLRYINNDALLISSNKYVRYIISHFKMMLEPDLRLHHVEILSTIAPDLNIVKDHEQVARLVESWQQLHKGLSGTSLLEMAEVLLNQCNHDISEADTMYIQSFLEEVLQYQIKYDSFIPEFLVWWEEKERKMQLPENINAMRMMTIHQSKGLEFPIVILPYLNWKFAPSSKQKNILWVDYNYKGRPLKLPIDFKHEYLNSDFRYETLEECINTGIDKLNLLYVACTRPVKELYIIADKPKKPKKDEWQYKQMNIILSDICENSEFDVVEQSEFADQYILGTKQTVESTHKEHSLDEISVSIPTFRTELPNLRMKAWEEDSLSPESDSKVKLITGNVVHQILENITTLTEVQDAITQAIYNGLIAKEEKEQWIEYFDELFASDDIAQFFQPSYEVLNERKIYTSSGKVYIPDRVLLKDDEIIIIDYKTGERNQKHAKQLNNYKHLYTEMGYQTIRTYVLYTELKELEEIR